MTELTWILDPTSGALVVEARSAEEVSAIAGDLLPPGREVGCARPLAASPLPAASATSGPMLRVARIYHGSVVDGPGRRSVCQLQGCVRACPNCYVPETHPRGGGLLLPVRDVLAALLDPAGAPRDGVTISGGEPFLQPDGLLALVRALRARGCPHIVCYSGYTYERLRHMAEQQPVIGAVLDEIDVLIDGPYVEALADDAGPWTGSGNQRVMDLAATCRAGQVVLLDE